MTNAERIQKIRNDYEAAFSSPQGERVLSDLRIFCGATKSSFDSDPYQTAYNEGLRRVWLRIESYLAMTDERILRLVKHSEDQYE